MRKTTAPNSMLDRLPSEILQQIIGHLPTVSAIINLACTNKRLHVVISDGQDAVFRDFVHNAFPTIKTPPLWQDMVRELTSRSRAWDRRAICARECYPHPVDETLPPPHQLRLYYGFGYTPAIDSFESYLGDSFASKKEALAIGAAGRLRLRTIQGGKATWNSFRTPDDHLPQNDILDLRLLKPGEHGNAEGESIIIRRADGTIVKIEQNSHIDEFSIATEYMIGSSNVNCMDVSRGKQYAQLAVFDAECLKLFPLHTDSNQTQPTIAIATLPKFPRQSRKRCARFLTNNKLATSAQFLDGRGQAPILIYDIAPDSITSTSLTPQHTISDATTINNIGRHSATALETLDNINSTATRPDQVFLSGWTDGTVHLHDLRRSPLSTASKASSFHDPVDTGKIQSLAAYGHEKFFAGSDQNGCLKMFDLRMPGSRVYSYLDAVPRTAKTSGGGGGDAGSSDTATLNGLNGAYPKRESVRDHQTPNVAALGLGLDGLRLETHTRRGINIFLAVAVNQNERLWEPLPLAPQLSSAYMQDSRVGHGENGERTNSNRHQRQHNHYNNRNRNRLTRYQGPVYSLSAPSASSATLFAGIRNHVIQLDFVSTDDVRRNIIQLPTIESAQPLPSSPMSQSSIHGNNSHHGPNQNLTAQILDLSCYERPREGLESTDPVLLKKQLPFHLFEANNSNLKTYVDADLEMSPVEEWDERWRSGRSWRDR